MPARRFLLTLLALACGSAEAQDTTSTRQKVRYHRVSDGRQVQTLLLGRSDSSITVLDPVSARPVALTNRDVQKVAVHLGRNPLVGFGKGLLWGVGVGAAAGGVMGYADDPDPNSWFFNTRREQAALGAVVLGIVGGPIGAVIGAFTGGNRWEQVPLDASGVRLVVTGQGVGVRIPLGR